MNVFDEWSEPVNLPDSGVVLDDDGVFEVEAQLPGEELLVDPAAVEFPDLQFDAAGPDSGELVVEGQLIGDPEGASEHWFEQAANGFCVPASVAQIVSEYSGVHHGDELAFVERANELHLFVVGPDGVPGINAEGAAALLEDAGIPAESVSGLTMDNLVQYVDEGRGVLLAVDSGELWYGETENVDEAADHALVLTGFDPEAGVAILSDPGSPTGDEFEVPISELERMWADSGNTAVVCDVPPGELPGATFEPTVEPTAVPAQGNNAVIEWLLQHPYVLIPVVLGIAAVARRK